MTYVSPARVLQPWNCIPVLQCDVRDAYLSHQPSHSSIPQGAAHDAHLPLGKPLPLIDERGAPWLQLLIADDLGLLQLHTQLPIEHTRPQSSSLASSLTAVSVELLLRMKHGDTLLAQARASTLPPFTALFSVQLDAEMLDRVLAALQRQPGILRVRYRLVYTIHHAANDPQETPLQCEGDIADWIEPNELRQWDSGTVRQ